MLNTIYKVGNQYVDLDKVVSIHDVEKDNSVYCIRIDVQLREEPIRVYFDYDFSVPGPPPAAITAHSQLLQNWQVVVSRRR